ncbi:MAG TPA: polyamine ABC transporter substrate-binding protein [Steroidobacteraceae bacterium]|nr:polyamine ABC transporter substrate-binding protein [Steroidobacteraceae bacterium]
MKTQASSIVRSSLLGVLAAAALVACGKKEEAPSAGAGPAQPAAEEKVLNLYIWNDYLAPDTLANFEKETGIKVSVSNYGSNEELDAKLAPGNAGYDVVVPSASSYERQIKAGYYQKLDKSLLPNLKNMDPDIEARLAMHDPGNEYAVLHMWGTTGIGYNVKKIKEAMPNAPLDSWALVFDPKVVSHFKKCGVAMLDSATEMYSMTLAALGKDPNSQNPEDLEAATNAMVAIRPNVRYFDTQRMISDLANGEICLAVGYNGDILQARDRAEENKTGAEIRYSIPKEGTIIWFDSYLIPKDAPHPKNAHAFINYMLRPEVIAAVTNTVNYANGNSAATQYVDKDVLEDPGVYPPPEIKAHLVPDLADTEETTRIMTRGWQKVTTGK